MFIWIALNSAIYITGLVVLFLILRRKVTSSDLQLVNNLELAKKEKETKTNMLKELKSISLGMIEEEQLKQKTREKEKLEEQIRTETGRISITEAELEALDTRLREIEELKRELEISNLDTIKELELLKAQEREVNSRNQALRDQLDTSLEQLDLLMDMLQSSAEAVARLSNAKKDLIETEKRCTVINEEIASTNAKYMMLKRSYDALDIEYAQLYEKQQLAEENK